MFGKFICITTPTFFETLIIFIIIIIQKCISFLQLQKAIGILIIPIICISDV